MGTLLVAQWLPASKSQRWFSSKSMHFLLNAASVCPIFKLFCILIVDNNLPSILEIPVAPIRVVLLFPSRPVRSLYTTPPDSSGIPDFAGPQQYISPGLATTVLQISLAGTLPLAFRTRERDLHPTIRQFDNQTKSSSSVGVPRQSLARSQSAPA
ncbi:hypothetical protein F5Y18DRAFT_142601 [Xylariaceae sp. FL1019]|nr:hypothetical protein F5Y18DRAFT_142601 [Xylariaceae sp. FL1019]